MNKFTVFLFMISIAFFTGCSDNTNNTAVKITPGIEKYSAFMSSVPGFPLTAELEKENTAEKYKFHWQTDDGSLLTWGLSDWKVRDNGKDIITESAKIYWSYLTRQDENSPEVEVRLEVLNKNNQVLGKAKIMLVIDDKGYVTVKQ